MRVGRPRPRGRRGPQRVRRRRRLRVRRDCRRLERRARTSSARSCAGPARLRAVAQRPRGAAAARARWIAATASSGAASRARAAQTIARARRLISVTVWRRSEAPALHDGRLARAGLPCRPDRPAAAPRLRGLFELEQPLRQRDQRAGEVAAVDGRDVARVQRRQGRRVVPVQEVSLIVFEPLERRKRRVQAAEQRLGGQVPESRARPASTAGSCRCWSATCGGPASARRRPPGSCPAAARRRLR